MNKDRVYLSCMILAVLGLLVSIYLTVYHYSSSVPLACPDTGLINCASVLNSAYAYILGVPLAVYGLVFFVVELVILNLRYKDLKAVYNALGLVFVFYFIYLEYLIGHICIFCTTVHVTIVLLFILTLYDAAKHG